MSAHNTIFNFKTLAIQIQFNAENLPFDLLLKMQTVTIHFWKFLNLIVSVEDNQLKGRCGK